MDQIKYVWVWVWVCLYVILEIIVFSEIPYLLS